MRSPLKIEFRILRSTNYDFSLFSMAFVINKASFPCSMAESFSSPLIVVRNMASLISFARFRFVAGRNGFIIL